MEHININKQPYSKKKKAMTITALVAAGAIIIGGTKIACNKKLKKQRKLNQKQNEPLLGVSGSFLLRNYLIL